MTPYYQDDAVTIYHGDCYEIIPLLPKADLMLTDPPYGMNRANSGHKVIQRLGAVIGDDKPFDPRPFLIADNHIFWGANHYASRLPDSSSWFMWLKHDVKLWGLRSTSPFELAWTDLGGACKAIRHIWDGSIKQGEGARQEHVVPTEKPVELLRWCLGFFPHAMSVIDPFMGSGPTIEAGKHLGRKVIGIEIEERYCEIAANRLRQEVLNFG